MQVEEQTTLPVLHIEVGEVVSSNADAFRAQVSEWVAGFNTDLKEDADFVQAESDVKRLKEAEDAVTDAKAGALKEAEELNTLLETLDETSEEIRQARLDLSRKIQSKKDDIKKSIIEDGEKSIGTHAAHFRPQIEAAIKGKRTLDTMREAVQEVVNRAETLIQTNYEKIEAFKAEHPTLVPDATRLEVMPTESLKIELDRRRERAEAEAEKARLIAEAEEARRKAEDEQARLRAEAQAARAPEPNPEPETREPHTPAAHTPAPSAQINAPDAESEMEWFRQQVKGALGRLREPREALSDPGNQRRAEAFRQAVGEAYTAHLT